MFLDDFQLIHSQLIRIPFGDSKTNWEQQPYSSMRASGLLCVTFLWLKSLMLTTHSPLPFPDSGIVLRGIGGLTFPDSSFINQVSGGKVAPHRGSCTGMGGGVKVWPVCNGSMMTLHALFSQWDLLTFIYSLLLGSFYAAGVWENFFGVKVKMQVGYIKLRERSQSKNIVRV